MIVAIQKIHGIVHLDHLFHADDLGGPHDSVRLKLRMQLGGAFLLADPILQLEPQRLLRLQGIGIDIAHLFQGVHRPAGGLPHLLPAVVHPVKIVPKRAGHGLVSDGEIQFDPGGNVPLVAYLQEFDPAFSLQPIVLGDDGNGIRRQIPLGAQIRPCLGGALVGIGLYPQLAFHPHLIAGCQQRPDHQHQRCGQPQQEQQNRFRPAEKQCLFYPMDILHDRPPFRASSYVFALLYHKAARAACCLP